MKRVHVCSTPGCAHLTPCPHHSRPANAPWSQDRDHKQHLKLRRQLIKQRGPTCQRCGRTFHASARGLHMHHLRPGNTPDAVILLCGDCHKEIDPHAR